MGEKKEREREEKVRTEEKKERRGVRPAVFSLLINQSLPTGVASWAISKDQIKLEGKLRSNPKGNCTFMKSSQ